MKKQKPYCLRCGIEKVKGYWEGGCGSWGIYYEKHLWKIPCGEEVSKLADTFRKEYTPLDDEQKEKMAAIKDKAQELLDLFDSTVTREERSDRSRCMAVARTNLETTIMWAIKGVTSAKVNTSFDNRG